MLADQTAPDFRLARLRTARLRPARHRLLRGDPRRFGQATPWSIDTSATETESSGDLRLFAHSFAGFFLFFSLLIA